MVPTVFLCYDREDKRVVGKLRKHLGSLINTQRIVLLDEGDIIPGAEWKKEINRYLDESQIILLVISPSFLGSIEHWEIEMARSVELHEKGQAHVIPVILDHVDWEQLPIYKLKALPDDNKCISDWKPPAEGFKNVTVGIRKVVEQWNAHSLPAGTMAERRVLMTNLDTFIEAVQLQMQPPARADHTTGTLKQLSIFIPNDATLADLIVGWQILSHSSQDTEDIKVVNRRITCGELAMIASQFTTEQGSLARAINIWGFWVRAFKNSNGDSRQISMLNTFTRELSELQAAAHS